MVVSTFWPWVQSEKPGSRLRGKLFDVGGETKVLPLDKKLNFKQGNDGMSFGFVSLAGTTNAY